MLEGRCELFYGEITGETLRPFGVKTLQRLDTSEATSRADSQSLIGQGSWFLTNCDAMEFAETRHL